MPDATRLSPPSTRDHRPARRCCGISPIARTAGAKRAGVCPAQSARNGSRREFDRPSASSGSPAATDRGVRKSACSLCRLAFRDTLLGARAGPVVGPVGRVSMRYQPMSAVFSRDIDWPPRFATNWTHRGPKALAVAQCRCRVCPKPRAFVYRLGNRTKPAPVAASADGALAFCASGSRRASFCHASVTALTGSGGSRVAMLPVIEPHKENP